ncbi:MAG: hypothetical protein ABJG88_06845 [Litorimonas sp.]
MRSLRASLPMSAAFAIANHHCTPVAANDSMPEGYNMPEVCNVPPATVQAKALTSRRNG